MMIPSLFIVHNIKLIPILLVSSTGAGWDSLEGTSVFQLTHTQKMFINLGMQLSW